MAHTLDESNGAVFSVERVGVIDLGEVLRQSQATNNVRVLLDEKRELNFKSSSPHVKLTCYLAKNLLKANEVSCQKKPMMQVRLFQDEVATVQRGNPRETKIIG